MLAGTKNEKVRLFESEEAFYQYLNSLMRQKGYVLVETSPLIKNKVELLCPKAIFSENQKG
ncbi:MAG: hypothetical protein PHQ25_07060 [Acidobacteriota bacterium]|nr:hypothetical protein [Acidobacteriota bacterium]